MRDEKEEKKFTGRMKSVNSQAHTDASENSQVK